MSLIRLVGVLLLALALSGCGQRPSYDAEAPLLLIGRLDGDPSTGCLWIASPQDPAVRKIVKWPSEYTIVPDPLRLVDARGREVARIGDLVEVGAISGGADTRVEPDCRVGDTVVIARQVRSVESPGVT